MTSITYFWKFFVIRRYRSESCYIYITFYRFIKKFSIVAYLVKIIEIYSALSSAIVFPWLKEVFFRKCRNWEISFCPNSLVKMAHDKLCRWGFIIDISIKKVNFSPLKYVIYSINGLFMNRVTCTACQSCLTPRSIYCIFFFLFLFYSRIFLFFLQSMLPFSYSSSNCSVKSHSIPLVSFYADKRVSAWILFAPISRL